MTDLIILQTYSQFFSKLFKVASEWELVHEKTSSQVFETLDLLSMKIHAEDNEQCGPMYSILPQTLSILRHEHTKRIQGLFAEIKQIRMREYGQLLIRLQKIEKEMRKFYFQKLAKDALIYREKKPEMFVRIGRFLSEIGFIVSNYSKELQRKQRLIDEFVQLETINSNDITSWYNDFVDFQFIDREQVNNLVNDISNQEIMALKS